MTGLHIWEIKRERHRERACSPHEAIWGSALGPLPGSGPRPRGDLGAGEQDAPRSICSSDREGHPSHPDLEAQGPRETRPREDAQKAPERPLVRSRRAWVGTRVPPDLALLAAAWPIPTQRPAARRGRRAAGRAACAAPSSSKAHSLLQGLGEPCTPGAAGKRRVRHSPGKREPGRWNRGSGREGPRGQHTSASPQPFVRLRGCHRRASVTSVIQTARQWRGRTAGILLVPPLPGAAGTAAQESRAGKPAPRRMRTRTPSWRRAPLFLIPRLGEVSSPLSAGSVLQVARQRSRKGKVFPQNHEGDFSFKRQPEDAFEYASFCMLPTQFVWYYFSRSSYFCDNFQLVQVNSLSCCF